MISGFQETGSMNSRQPFLIDISATSELTILLFPCTPRETDAIRSLVRYRRSLADEITRIKNQGHSILARHGITIDAADIFGKRTLKKIQESGDKMQPEDGYILADLIQRFHDVSSRAENLEKR